MPFDTLPTDASVLTCRLVEEWHITSLVLKNYKSETAALKIECKILTTGLQRQGVEQNTRRWESRLDLRSGVHPKHDDDLRTRRLDLTFPERLVLGLSSRVRGGWDAFCGFGRLLASQARSNSLPRAALRPFCYSSRSPASPTSS
mmetsp:Transcript_29709/g.60714  ORF Transcript_29709/g.60714 Transcript_29709/m.60714 type:complete len:145 (+) Transcript_29709:1008-1442(+)